MVEGRSRAGDETWFRIKPPGIAFDAGRGPLRLTGVRDLFVTHGHLDHALGLPFLLSHRAMQPEAPTTRIVCPRPVAETVKRFIEAASALEGREYDFELLPVAAGDRIAVQRDFDVEAFATEHPVPSVGYHLWRRRTRLAPELEGAEPAEIARLSSQGAEVGAEIEELLLSYCGDTGPGVFEREPRLFESAVLMIETTYLGSEMRARGAAFGHLHLEDLVAHQDRFRNGLIVLHHLSRRHRPSDLRRAVDERLPAIADKVHVWE